MPRLLDAPARLPRGLPPRLPRVPPRPLPRPPEPRVADAGVLEATEMSPGSGASFLIRGFLVPLPVPLPRALPVPLLTPLIGLEGGLMYCCCGAKSIGLNGIVCCNTSPVRGLTSGAWLDMFSLMTLAIAGFIGAVVKEGTAEGA